MPEFRTNQALVLSARPLGERSYIISLLTPDHGRHIGVFQKRHPPETGAWVSVRWRARLAEQMGQFYLEEVRPFSVAYLDDKKRLACITCLCRLLDDLLPERQSFPELYQAVFDFLDHLDETDFLKYYVLLEQKILTEIGFGLDTTACAGGGNPHDLAYISPKTGRAVSREKGESYKTKLLPLPRFLWQSVPATEADIRTGLNLTGYFLQTYALKHPLPPVRSQLF